MLAFCIWTEGIYNLRNNWVWFVKINWSFRRIKRELCKLSLFREMRRILLICRRHWRNLLYEVSFLYICCCFNISLHFNFIQDYRQSCRFQDHVLNELTFKCKSIANNLISWLNIIIILKKLVLNIFRKNNTNDLLWIYELLRVCKLKTTLGKKSIRLMT